MFLVPLRKIRKLLFILIVFIIGTSLLWRALLSEDLDKSLKRKKVTKWKNQEEYIDKRGVHVVVGHYIGDAVHKLPSATNDMINTNNFAPEPLEGHMGMPVITLPKDLLKMQQLFQINRFNLLASDRIPLNRSLPDVRRKKCQKLYTDHRKYPKSSVIIVFHNEAWSTLLRTVWSVINRSPRSLLEEIILVDDASERAFLKEPLYEYVSKLPVKTSLLRTGNRTGLVKARLMGARYAKGEVLTFLDAHCECTTGWLESLVGRIAEDHTTIVCPVIDIINDDTFAYVKSFELHWGAFNWNLQFRWYTLRGAELEKRKKDQTRPFMTPAMAGGLFAINKEYFFELGAYDEGMNVWGGENLELSFRAWQCGGRIEIAPCSHVGHLFRKSSPYTFPGGITETLYSNLARVALVWMDKWANFYFRFNENARKAKEGQNVIERRKLRRKLKCQNFSWYLDNIWPQHFFPKLDRFFGRIYNYGKNQCLVRPLGRENSNQPMGLAKLNVCVPESSIQMFVMTKEGFIMTDDSICLDAPEKPTNGPARVRIMACSGYSRQKWTYNYQTHQLIHTTNQLCLDLMNNSKNGDELVINNCTKANLFQQWQLQHFEWF